MAIEIKVDKKELQISEKALGNLANQVSNRKIAASLNNSEGNLAKELRIASEQLALIGESLCQLITKTEVAVKNTWVQFEETDTTVAHYFGIKEDSE